MELLDNLRGGLVQPLLHADLRLLLQVCGVGRARLSLHLGVFRQLQLLEALKLWDPMHTRAQKGVLRVPCVTGDISEAHTKSCWHCPLRLFLSLRNIDLLILKTFQIKSPCLQYCRLTVTPGAGALTADKSNTKTRGSSYSASLTRRKSNCSTTAPDIRVYKVDEEK